MKKILLVVLVFFGLQTQAQVGTDLEFSQAFTWCATNATYTEPPPYNTVPAGKIWKIVGYSGHSYIDISIGNSGLVRLGANYTSLPLFISENKLVAIYHSQSYGFIGCISIVEYTVIP